MTPEDPHYGLSVAYGPCPNCGEGSLTYDREAETTTCPVCGATDGR